MIIQDAKYQYVTVPTFQVKDNGTFRLVPPGYGTRAFKRAKSALGYYAGKNLKALSEENPGLLVFPSKLDAYTDGIEGLVPYHLFGDNLLSTGNVVGFMGWKDGNNQVQLDIYARFDEFDARQYFFHYMLQRVFCGHVVNLPTSATGDNVWDFLPYLFPYCLKKAFRQGLYRAYQTFEHNDDRIRGSIDLPAFIRRDIPFCGRVAYTTRERTINNPIFHLIRHTIEHIRKDRRMVGILSLDHEMQQCVQKVIEATPDYQTTDRIKVVRQNLRSVRHPYYTEYTALQKVCLKILRHEKMSYGTANNEVYGILFDAAWLWEEYLNTLLSRLHFKHPQNKQGTGAEYLYTNNTGEIYPDFLSKSRKIVLDAKYKRLDKKGLREDRFQIITYIHVLWKDAADAKGYLVYPSGNGVEQAQDEASFTKIEGTLKEGGGTLGTIAFKVPSLSENEKFSDFCAKMKAEEERFLDNKIFQQSPQS